VSGVDGKFVATVHNYGHFREHLWRSVDEAIKIGECSIYRFIYILFNVFIFFNILVIFHAIIATRSLKMDAFGHSISSFLTRLFIGNIYIVKKL
jgi:hypothetical protein